MHRERLKKNLFVASLVLISSNILVLPQTFLDGKMSIWK